VNLFFARTSFYTLFGEREKVKLHSQFLIFQVESQTSPKIMAMKVTEFALLSTLYYLEYESSTKFYQTLSAKNAAALDKDLMSIGAFSIDQLMELAGLSVSQAGLHSLTSRPSHFLRR
jgi:hypothetical protein